MDIDISDKIGPSEPREGCSHPMYSFSRAAYMVWGAVFNGLVEGGTTQEQAFAYLQGRPARWALDGDLGTALKEAGKAWGLKEAHEAKKY